jgi:hypothetical protein
MSWFIYFAHSRKPEPQAGYLQAEYEIVQLVLEHIPLVFSFQLPRVPVREKEETSDDVTKHLCTEFAPSCQALFVSDLAPCDRFAV